MGVTAVAFAAALATGEVPSLQTHEPRAYGYQVGDTLRREVVITLPPGWTLDAASLPRPGGRGGAIELRRLSRRDAGGRVTLELEYQVMLAPAAVRTLEIAPASVRVDSAARSQTLRIDAAPVTVAPLVPAAAPAREGLGEWQPDRAPPPIDTMRWRQRLALWGLLALAPLAWLFAVHVGQPWRGARRRPFALAWRELRRLPAAPDAAARRAALRCLHAALNGAAGEAVFEAGLPRFVERQPRYAPLQAELARFLAASRADFFGGRPDGDGFDPAWLVGLARRLRDAERGGA
jgi:mxaA protein